ncbi:hypothetical protein SAMN02799631_05971 [Methylobacterium sp. 174MFSha1.1]|uniref:hypothetical protein n=1 Tax=Methylobacterium sp. 174MFSha1.1 TaxID=1502749 RepID=UPI0008E9F386|nr:hypothetical protein [Methylobacterium sp. 174MFSha1.1]SFV14848.1 hypothetical protein SAMN02799631_05971 [Methylobacterium sp. 174MFSha1.1]
MRAGLMVGLVALGSLAAAAPAEARGRRGGAVFFFSSRSHAAPAERVTGQAPVQEPRTRTAAAEAGGPEPITTGTTLPVVPREAAPAPVPAPARPWCTGRVFGSGEGFCAIN